MSVAKNFDRPLAQLNKKRRSRFNDPIYLTICFHAIGSIKHKTPQGPRGGHPNPSPASSTARTVSLFAPDGEPPGNVVLNQDMLNPSDWNVIYFPDLVAWEVNSTGQLTAGWAELRANEAGEQVFELIVSNSDESEIRSFNVTRHFGIANFTAVPEPSSIMCLSTLGIGLLSTRRKRKPLAS